MTTPIHSLTAQHWIDDMITLQPGASAHTHTRVSLSSFFLSLSSEKVTALIVAICAGVASAQLRGGLPLPRSTYDRDAVILKQNYDLNPDGSYVYNFETSNGIRADETGYLKNPGTQVEAQVMQGSYSYTGPDGIVYTITYIADENGYRAEGAHIPTPPPVRAANPPRYNFK